MIAQVARRKKYELSTTDITALECVQQQKTHKENLRVLYLCKTSYIKLRREREIKHCVDGSKQI